MPFAQWHYPFENEQRFKEQFPADFISEAVDQTRGWFYTLMAISTLLFDRSPYKSVIVLGLILDKDGLKMSKSKGNAVDPMESLAKHGADAVRWYFYSNSAPWLANRYYDEAVGEAQRRFMGTLWNTYAFYVLYAEIDQFDPKSHEWDKDSLSVMDKWILSRLNSLIVKADESLSRLELTEPARALNTFVDELSNWYVRRCRERYWGKDMPRDKINAYLTLYHVLVTVSKLAAPFVPFMTELMYRNLVCSLDKNVPESIHLCDYPAADAGYIDEPLEKNMRLVSEIVALGRAARNAAAVKNRQPLPEMLVALKENEPIPADTYLQIIREELNVKRISFIGDAADYKQYKFKPQLRTLGPKYGKLVPKITEALNQDSSAAMEALRQGVWRCTVEGTDVALTMDDVLQETVQREGYAAQSDRGITVVLNIQMTPELIEEGFVRELVSKLQTMRRDAGFEVTDRIQARYGDNEVLGAVIGRNHAFIADEVLADNLSPRSDVDASGYSKEWDVNGERIWLSVKR
jgi:isoleucyl-tRNA synthetase